MGESIELIEGDHILEPVEEAVAMYEDLLTDLRKFLVTISHSFVTLHLFQAYALFRGPPKCMMPFEYKTSATESSTSANSLWTPSSNHTRSCISVSIPSTEGGVGDDQQS